MVPITAYGAGILGNGHTQHRETYPISGLIGSGRASTVLTVYLDTARNPIHAISRHTTSKTSRSHDLRVWNTSETSGSMDPRGLKLSETIREGPDSY